MLSAYETGKQKPSLDTLEKILSALECDLNDLHNSLQIVNERPEAIRRPGSRDNWQTYRQDGTPESPEAGGLNVYRVLGLSRQIPPQEEQALSEMLEGFHKLVRYLHNAIATPPTGGGGGTAPDEEPS
jgi:transcriptional regulator with XRE-family HTH domain